MASDTTARMDKKGYDETVKRLRAVNKVVAELDPAIRSAAWDLLKPFVTAAHADGEPSHHGEGGRSGDSGQAPPHRKAQPLDMGALLDQHASDDKKTENGLLVAAILYGTYGDGPFTSHEFTALGDEHRLPMPHMHNLLPKTKRDNKKVFRQSKDGWMITGSGGKWLRETYGVKRGTEPKSE